MIVASAWTGKRYGVLGLARSGRATVDALRAGGAQVVAWDSDPARREGVDAEIADLAALDLTGFDALVVSPGVPLNTHPLAARAREAGVPVIGDIELFAQARADLPAHKVVGITGTNGKSTTTALVHHILQTAGVPALMGGNIGLPILAQEPLPEGGVYVLELSSYQIDLTRTLDCDVAVLLNVTPDHLDRYDGMKGYAASKLRLFAMQSAGRPGILGEHGFIDDMPFDEMVEDVVGVSRIDLRPISAECLSDSGAAIVGGTAYWDGRAFARQQDWPALKGPHNARNVLAAVQVAGLLCVDMAAVAWALASFQGLPHRMERVGEHRGVAFVNDSKATNPESTAPALGAFDRVHWIVGGKAKGDDLDACRPYFAHVARAYTIGEAGPRFAEVLRPHLPVEEAGTLDSAVASAAANAVAGETVLLSPAAASFDQFRDYEHRGAAFRALVEALS